MKKLKIILVTFFSTLILVAPVLTFAQTDALTRVRNQAKTVNQLPTTNPQQLIGMVIRVLMMFMGAIMFLLIVYAGVLWMTASGNSEKIAKAKNIIIWSALGVAAMLSSYIVVNFVFSKLEKGAQ